MSAPNPIVLVPGLAGFDRVRVAGVTLASYFPGIEAALRAAGFEVHVASVAPIDGVRERAARLRTFVRRAVPAGPVHLIAHSMGGLDSRYMITRLDMADRVRSLITVGTPHRGSPFADWGIARPERILRMVFDYFDIPRQAFYDLTTTACAAFNAEVPDVPGVRYAAVAGRIPPDGVSPVWWMSHGMVRDHEGDNDGVVSVASATWGERTDVWDGDHLDLVNWPNPWARFRGTTRDRAPDYVELARRVVDTDHP